MVLVSQNRYEKTLYGILMWYSIETGDHPGTLCIREHKCAVNLVYGICLTYNKISYE